MKIHQMRVKDIMQKKVHTIAKKETLTAAAKKMIDLKASSFVVEPADDSDTFGIITRKDMVEALMMDVEEELTYTVEDVMSKPAITIDANISIPNCLKMMRMVGARRLPVVQNGKLIGIISNTDVFRTVASELG